MKNLVFIFIAISILNSCSISSKKNNGNVLLIEQSSKQYKAGKVFFPKELVEHFPVEFNANSLRYSVCYSNELGPLSLYLVNHFSSINELPRNLISYSASDSCLLIINKFATLENYINLELTEKDKRFVELDCYDNKLPIPNFYEFNYDNNNNVLWQFDKNIRLSDCKLPFDYKINVIDAKTGKYVNDSLLSTNIGMPKAWEHGYSRGVAYSIKDSIIIYWLNIW